MRTIAEVAEDIKSILNNIERTQECNGETLVDINEFVDEILSINVGRCAINPIAINKGEVLILKTDILYRPEVLEKMRNNIIRQIESGVVVVPANFSYEIWEREEVEQEGEA